MMWLQTMMSEHTSIRFRQMKKGLKSFPSWRDFRTFPNAKELTYINENIPSDSDADVRSGSILLKKGSRFLANSDSVCLRHSAAEVCHDGSADVRSEPAIL